MTPLTAGSKTTYDFSNRENARRLVQSRVPLRNSKILFFEVSSPTNRKRIFEPLVAKYKAGSDRSLSSTHLFIHTRRLPD